MIDYILDFENDQVAVFCVADRSLWRFWLEERGALSRVSGGVLERRAGFGVIVTGGGSWIFERLDGLIVGISRGRSRGRGRNDTVIRRRHSQRFNDHVLVAVFLFTIDFVRWLGRFWNDNDLVLTGLDQWFGGSVRLWRRGSNCGAWDRDYNGSRIVFVTVFGHWWAERAEEVRRRCWHWVSERLLFLLSWEYLVIVDEHWWLRHGQGRELWDHGHRHELGDRGQRRELGDHECGLRFETIRWQ